MIRLTPQRFFWGDALYFVIMNPLLEESFWRGVIYRQLAERRDGPQALVISSVGVELASRAGVAEGALSYVFALLVSTALLVVFLRNDVASFGDAFATTEGALELGDGHVDPQEHDGGDQR